MSPIARAVPTLTCGTRPAPQPPARKRHRRCALRAAWSPSLPLELQALFDPARQPPRAWATPAPGQCQRGTPPAADRKPCTHAWGLSDCAFGIHPSTSLGTSTRCRQIRSLRSTALSFGSIKTAEAERASSRTLRTCRRPRGTTGRARQPAPVVRAEPPRSIRSCAPSTPKVACVLHWFRTCPLQSQPHRQAARSSRSPPNALASGFRRNQMHPNSPPALKATPPTWRGVERLAAT
mmetsp:Transcript_102161/g.288561  ORF Transcript_102161/g.288561 Transcript_102161/m.288561 type:complete len:236 (+) Transcript_102161:124-831(+)